MPFQLPDLRVPAPPQPVTLFPEGRPIFTREQAEAKLRTSRAWFKPLTHKQRRFIGALFANGFDIAEAALEADPSITDLKTARRIGNNWYGQVAVKAAIEEVYNYYQESTKVRFDDLVEELRLIAFSSIGDHVSAEGDPRLLDDTDPRTRVIKKITRRQTKYGEETTIEMHDKLGAIGALMRISAPKGVNVGAIPGDPDKGDTVVNVQTINIIPVPSGSFLPPPPEPTFAAPLIEHMPIISNAGAVAPENVGD